MIPSELTDFIHRFDSFLVLGHKDPDGDCLCSQRAMDLFLRRTGKKSVLCSPGPFTRKEIESMESLFQKEVPPVDDKEKTAVIILDCSTLERIGSLASQIEGLYTVVIDHHSTGNSFGDINYIRPEYPSTTLLVQEIIEEINGPVTQDEADLIMLGFSTDTGFFRHLDSYQNHVFTLISRLAEAGASPRKTYRAMHEGHSLATRRLMGRILDRTAEYYDGKLLISYEVLSDREELQTQDRDSESLYQLMLSIKDCEVVCIIRQESIEKCTIGLRATDEIDVGHFAARHNGGGHQKASGFSMEGSVEEIMEIIKNEFAAYLK